MIPIFLRMMASTCAGDMYIAPVPVAMITIKSNASIKIPVLLMLLMLLFIFFLFPSSPILLTGVYMLKR